ncbi:hypothetical protein Tco_1013043 [Tanacetum coccineum]
MHTSKDDYLINTLKFVSEKEATQIYGAILPESLTSPEMKETKAYKTYLGFATGATPPKIARKFKKASSSKKDLNLNLSSSKRKEKVDVAKGKGIELLSKVALTEDAQYEEVRKKSLRDFHKTHPSGSGTVTKIAPSAAKLKPSGNDEDDNNDDHDSSGEDNDQENDSDDDKTQSNNENESDSVHETNENETGSESDHQENEEEDENADEEKEDEYVRTPSYYSPTDDNDKTNVDDNAEADDETVQKEGTDAGLTNIQQGIENPEISQVIEDSHVTLYTVPQKTEVLVTSSSHSFNLASKFLNFSDIPHTVVEIVSPMDVHVHHEVPSNQTPTLLTVPISVITESSPIFTTVTL